MTTRDGRRELDSCIEEINASGAYVRDIENIKAKLSKIIKRNPGNTEAYLWRGILRRIAGNDGRNDLYEVLRRRPGHRLALLNLAAMPLTVIPLSLEKSTIACSLKIAENFVIQYPEDLFAAVIRALLNAIDKVSMDGIIDDLERIYLRDTNNILSLTALACMLYYGFYRSAAEDYAREAIRKDPENIAANSLLSRFPSCSIEEKLTTMPYEAVRSGMGFHEKWGLMTPYAQQDIQYRLSRPNNF